MKKIMLSMALAPLFVTTAFTASAAEGINILDDLKFNGEIRPRFESADVKDNGVDAGNAFTVRTKLGVNAKLMGVNGLSTYLEVTSVNNLGADNYAPEDASYDTIPDPAIARMTQAYVDHKAGDTLIRAGRQMVNLDDQRFVGAVGWRQMFQTFDALSVVDNSVKGLTLLGSYVWERQGITDALSMNTKSVLLNAKYKVSDSVTVAGYGYLLGSIHDTYGVRVTGKIPAGDVKLGYDVSYAMQKDATLEYGNNTAADIDADYYNVALNGKAGGVIFGAGYEVLGEADGSSTKGFTTPLATLHKFQGWADVYLSRTAGSNNEGLEDLSLKIGYADKSFGKVLAVYHKFDAQSGANDDLGSEIDVLYATKVPGFNNLKALAKAAFFSKGDTGNDVEKYWVQLGYKF
jgi:hypothetical protein